MSLADRLRVLQLLRIGGLVGYASLAGGMAALTLWAGTQSPDFPFLSRSADAAWIGAPGSVSTDSVPIDRANLRPLRFIRRFTWNPPATLWQSSAVLEMQIRALTDASVWLNGRLIAERRAAGETSAASWNWKRGETIRAEGLVRGTNRLEIDVRNASGPALLELSAMAPGLSLATDSSWLVEVSGRDGVYETNASVANDTRRGTAGRGGESGWTETRARLNALIGLATLCGLLSLALRRWGSEISRRVPWLSFPMLCGAAVALFWLVVLISNTSQLPAYWGYDGPDHLNYVRFIAQHAALPVATDGPAMYHPPLFYLLSAGLLSLFPGADEGSVVLRLLPFLSGLTQVGVALLLARRLFPGDGAIGGLAVLIAGLLPMNVYMSAYLSNEPMQAALSAIAILLVTNLLLQRGMALGSTLALGSVIGLALLTKITPLLLLLPMLVLLGLKHAAIDRAPWQRQIVVLAAVVSPAALIAGWYYVRNWLLLGQPVVGNWDVPGARVSWWQHPGFHTSDYFLGFGESLRQPFFAGIHSFWDGLHATLWSDSLIGGVMSIAQRHHVWNYEWMAVLPVIALPAVVIGVAGVGALARESLRGDDARRRVALGFAAAIVIVYAFALFLINLRLPFYAQAKASYALAVLAPLAVSGAFATASLHRALDTPGRRPAQVILHAWAGSLAVAVLLAFGG